MKITICGSIAFFDEMMQYKSFLEKTGHEVRAPPADMAGENSSPMPVKDYYAARKSSLIRGHFRKVGWADAVLVLNHEKKGIPGYVGANALMEMVVAFHLCKKMFLLNPPPDQPCREEILGMQPTVLNGDLGRL